MKDVPIATSSHEYTRGASQAILDKRDLYLPAPAERVLKKASQLKALDLFMGDRATVVQTSPNFEASFRDQFNLVLHELIEDKPAKVIEVVGGAKVVTGLDIVRAYERSVDVVVTAISKQFRTGMYMPQVYGKLLDYFGIPMSLETIEELQEAHPQVAKDLRKARERWRNPLDRS